jgi:hypothetical protein
MLYFAHKHAFLLYSAAMEGRRTLTFQAADELEGECALATVARVLGGSFLSYTAWPWLVRLRFGAWGVALAETDDAAADPAGLLPFTAAMRHYVRAFALASSAAVSFSSSSFSSTASHSHSHSHLDFAAACAAAQGEARAFARLAQNETTRAEPLFLITAGQVFDVADATLRARMAGAGCGVGVDGGVGVDAGERPSPLLLRRGSRYDSSNSSSSISSSISNSSSSLAIREWARAAALVDAFPYMEPPMWPSNVRACLGQALLDAGRFAEAQRVFEADLAAWPANGWSLKGLELALKGQGEDAAARAAGRAFERAWRYADIELTDRSCF